MALYVCGGSNSVRKKGWTAAFGSLLTAAQNPRLGDTYTNISVGASPNLMGVVRLVFQTDLKPGDVVIWEYALNDEIGINLGYSEDLLLRSCEFTLRHCQQRGASIVPLIFVPRQIEQDQETGGMTRYRRKLIRLFKHYGVAYCDVSRTFRAACDVACLPDRHFLDAQHYSPDSEIVGFIARRALRLVG